MVGFSAAFLIFVLMRKYARNRALVEPPVGDAPPPHGTRAILVGTCTAVSFAHGSNDGQKGVGLVMLILIGLLPAGFALNPDASADSLARCSQTCRHALRGAVP